MLESHTFREPLIIAEGGNYRWQERFRKRPSDYKLRFAKDTQKDEFYDLRMVMTEDLRFSSDPEFGLEAVDIVTNTIRRSLSGNFSRAGWVAIPQLMIHRDSHYIKLILDPSRKSGGALHRLHCFCLEFDGACEVPRRVPTDWIIEPVDVWTCPGLIPDPLLI